MGSRGANGDGSCRQISDGRFAGKWRVQIIVKDTKGASKRLSRIFPTQKEGKAFIRSLQRDSDRASLEATRVMTLGAWIDWLAENDWNETLDSKTIRSRLVRFKKYVEKSWGGVPLTKIDPLDVKAFFHQLRDDGVGHATREAIKTDLVRVFNLAISPYKRVPTTWGNPFRLPMDAPPVRDAIALTPGEAKKALASKDLDDRQRAMLAVFLLGGLRISEQMALTMGQVNFKTGLIIVDRSVRVNYGGQQTIGLPKTKRIRQVVMCKKMSELLQPVCDGLEPDTYVFSAATGNKPRMKNLVYATWRTIVKDAKLPADMSPHDCRLTHINWIEKLLPEVSTTTLKEHIGHAAAGVTEVNYTRPITPAQDILRRGLDKLIK